jgi:hypothetical protein
LQLVECQLGSSASNGRRSKSCSSGSNTEVVQTQNDGSRTFRALNSRGTSCSESKCLNKASPTTTMLRYLVATMSTPSAGVKVLLISHFSARPASHHNGIRFRSRPGPCGSMHVSHFRPIPPPLCPLLLVSHRTTAYLFFVATHVSQGNSHVRVVISQVLTARLKVKRRLYSGSPKVQVKIRSRTSSRGKGG